MPPKVLHIRSLTPGVSPSTASLEIGQIGINVPDGLAYIRQSGSGADVVNPLLSANVKNTGNFILSGSSSITGSLNILGNTVQSGSNTLIGVTTLSGSVNISGSTVQVGNNTLLGNTVLSGSILISGSSTPSNPSVKVFGTIDLDGYLKLSPVDAAVDTSISASYVFVSGSTNDLYFAQNGDGYANVTRLRWLEGTLFTGLLKGGTISSTLGSTTFTITSGSGLIVQQNASVGSEPFPTVKYISWPNYTNYPIANSGSGKITYVGIDSSGGLVQQPEPWGSTSIDQFDSQIQLGVVLHLSGSVSSGVFNSPQTSYGPNQKADDFFRSFGPLKISGHTLQTSGSTLGLTKAGGTAYKDGANYSINPNHPSTVVENAVTTSKIYRYYVSGSTPIINTGANNAGFTGLDVSHYNLNGVLTPVPSNDFSIQRVFWVPNSPTNALVVYYGTATYPNLLTAINAKDSEVFTEAPNTATNAIFLGYVIVKETATNLTVAADCTIIQGGLFRSIGGVGSSGTSTTIVNLANLSDVLISNPTNGQALVYDAVALKWKNLSAITASLYGNASTATTASYALTASYLLGSATSSYATTASYSNIAGALVTGIDVSVNNITASVVSASFIIADGSQLTNIGNIDKIFYVSEQGLDTNDGKTMNTTFRTIKTAALAASASYAANAGPSQYRMSIHIAPGYYSETASIWVPPWTSLMGNDLRTTVVSPTTATKGENLFLMNNGTYAWGLRFEGCEIDDLENPRKGFFFAFAPGAFITTSPYIQNCSCINTPAAKFYSPLDATANPPNPLVGNGPGGMIVDDSVLDGYSPLKSMIVDAYTQVAFNGIGLCVRGRGYAQQVSFFTNFSRVGIFAMDGGHASLLNSNTTFGDYGLRSSGSRILIVPNISQISASIDIGGSTILSSEKTAIKNYMMSNLQTYGWYSASYLDTNSAVYAATMKDAGLVIDALTADLLVPKTARLSNFLQGEFKGQDTSNDQRYTLTAATGFTKGAVAAFRVNDGKHLAQDYTSSYKFMRDYIINDPDVKFTGMTLSGKQKVEQMLNVAIDVIRSVAIDVEPTYLQEFGSLITSTSHDFSYAGSGVNFLGLPVNQGGVGETNVDIRVYEEAGGRVYQTSGDETGDFFAGTGFVIKQATGTIEGRAFDKATAARIVPLNLALEST